MAPGVTVKAAATTPVLRLYGEVGVDVLVDDVARALDAAGGRDVEIHLFSPGGAAAEGIAIHNVLAAYKGRKDYVVDGLVASAGSIVPMAISKAKGDRRLMPSNALLMIHNCWGGSVGDADSMDAAAAMLRVHSQVYSTTYAKASGQSVEQIVEWMGAAQGGGTWFTAEAALAAGLIDAVIDPVDVRASVPALPAGRFPNSPGWVSKALASMVRIESGDHPEHSRAEHMPTQDQAGSAPAAVIEAPPVVASTEVAPVAPAVVQAAVSPVTSTAVADSVALANAQREIEIRRCAAEANIAPVAVQAMVDGGKPFADVALEIVKAHAGPLETVASKAGHPARIQVTRDSGDTLMTGLQDAIWAKIRPEQAMSDAARPYAGMRMMEITRVFAESRGHNTIGRSAHQLIALALHTGDDFTNLLANVANKTMMDGWAEENHRWELFATRQDLPDLKPANQVFIAGNLEPIRVVNGEPTDKTKADARVEGGEYQFATLQDGKVTWQLSKYTRGLRVAEEVFINDDLSGLAEVPDMFGRGGRRVQAKGIYGLITGNANVGIDGLPLFHASHNNTGTGTIGNTGWNTAVLKLSTQTDPAGNPLELDPALTLAPAALRGPMQQFLRPNNYMPSQLTGNAGPATSSYSGAIEDIYSARLDSASALQWYVMAAKTASKGIVQGYLQGESGPTLTTETKRNPDCLEFLFRMYWGCTLSDYRFIYRSSGVD